MTDQKFDQTQIHNKKYQAVTHSGRLWRHTVSSEDERD